MTVYVGSSVECLFKPWNKREVQSGDLLIWLTTAGEFFFAGSNSTDTCWTERIRVPINWFVA